MNQIKYLPLFLVFIAIALLPACGTKKQDVQTNAVPTPDTTGLAEYNKWKMENEIREQIKLEQQQTTVEPVPVATRRASSLSRSSSRSKQANGRENSVASNAGAASVETVGNRDASATKTQKPAPTPKKKGMSHTAKGAIVGAASGAVIGAIANKKDRVGGGVVGGVVGAATGAGVGVIVDKKEKKKNGN